ncbi:MAG: 4-hydroxy-tetrahydrodipicolinate reductase [Chloroflexota bacterium]|nr:4-hydroxy-tetrahydrodipicolinate reductase [Chloroflexota bacterium]
MIRICLAGATGWVGESLVPAIDAAPDLELVGVVARRAEGDRLAQALRLDTLSDPVANLIVRATVEEALAVPTDVLVDFTAPAAVERHVTIAIDRGVHVVIGTSGLSDAEYERIGAAAADAGVGVVAAGNFAITAVLMEHFALRAARHLASWEVIDYGSADKPDAPSGTARQLAARIAQVRAPAVQVPIEAIQGAPEARGLTLKGTQVHSVRLPGYVIGAEVLFGMPDERLSIRYESGNSAEPYVGGTLLAVRRVATFQGLRRGLDTLLDLDSN